MGLSIPLPEKLVLQSPGLQVPPGKVQKEVMYVYLKYMREHCKKNGVVLIEHVGEGMMYCWGAMELVPEARAVRQEYFAALM